MDNIIHPAKVNRRYGKKEEIYNNGTKFAKKATKVYNECGLGGILLFKGVRYEIRGFNGGYIVFDKVGKC